MELDWQHEFIELKDRGLHLLQTQKWADCHFLVGASPPNQKVIAGHKLILAMTSPVFERMFYGQLADTDVPIVIPDVQPDAFEAMLEYMYTDRVNISSFDKACELCYVAKKYMLPQVVKQCTSFLWSDLSPNNACRAYEFAKLFDEPRLLQSSMELIASNTRDVLADPSFTDIEMSTLMSILDQDKLNIDSELDLFNALLRFANERQMNRNNLSQSSKSTEQSSPERASSGVGLVQVEEIKMEPDVNAMMEGHDDDNFNQGIPSPEVVVVQSNSPVAVISENEAVGGFDGESLLTPIDQPSTSTAAATSSANAVTNLNYLMETQHAIIDEEMLKKAVRKIRFLTMTPQQFAEGPARCKLLDQHEALAILIKISSPSINDCPMPEGFCRSRSSRNYYEQRSKRLDLTTSCYELSLNCLTHGNYNSCGSLCIYDTVEPLTDHPQNQIITLNRNCNIPAHKNTIKTRDSSGLSLCVRVANLSFDYRNTSVTDSGLTFQVDTNILITGVQVPTQVLPGPQVNSGNDSERYTEIVYAHIQDIQGSRLGFTHYTSRAPYYSLLEISFERPVFIHRNRIYKVFVVFNKVGWYPMNSSVPDVICNRVKFRFNVGDPSESVRDGLIHSIAFKTP